MLEVTPKNFAKELERRRKIGEANKKENNPERCKKISRAMRARREELSRAIRGEKNPAKRPEVRRKISEAMKKENNPERCEKISKALEGRDVFWIRGLTKETDKRIAKRAQKLVGHKPFYPKAHYAPELGHIVRSSYEKEIGLILKKAGIPYKYEGKFYKFDGTSYRPDFPITDGLIVEAKGYLYKSAQEKYKKFKENYPDVTLVIVGGQNDVDYVPICDIHIPWEDREKLVKVVS